MTETSETWQIYSEIHVGDNIDESHISDAAPLQAWTVDSISPSETINGVTISFEAGPIGGKSQIFLKGKPTKAGTITWTIKLISSLYGSRHTHIITCILPIQGPYVESIEISGPDSIQVGKTATYTARVLPTDAYDTDIKSWGATGWTDSSKAVLKLVSESGSTAKVQALEVGSGYIIVVSSGKEGRDSDYPENNNITKLKNITVTEPPKYTYYARLYYNANGGSGAPSVQSDSIYAESASGYATFTIPSTKPVRQGFVFLGWSTSSSATSPGYQPGSTITVYYDSSKTLYAVWQKESIGKAKIDGVWKDISKGYVKVDGMWKTIDSVYMKINGSWKKGN